MEDTTEFGTWSCPFQLEAEEDEEKEAWTVDDKKKMALLKPSLRETIMDSSSHPLPTILELVPYKKSSPSHAPSTSQYSTNPEPVSPSIQDTGHLRNADSGNESPGFAEGSFSLDASTANQSPGATPGFKRLTKAHKVDRNNVVTSQKTELEREMELFEAAEREEEARLLTSLRHNNQSNECSTSPKSSNSMESIQTDWICVSSRVVGEQPRPKRGRRPEVNHQALKKEEDVCFACYDGGELILCDKRSCPKAYHMDCTGRESDFFRKKGQWLCGWHVCASCSGSANVHCYTCPNAYCNGCFEEMEFLPIRKGRGFCEQCFTLVNMIENNLTVDPEGNEVDFDDEETLECLHKAYWIDLRPKLSLTWSEIDKAHRAKEDGEPFSREEKLIDEGDRVSADSDYKPVTRHTQHFKRKRGANNTVMEDASCSEEEEQEEEEEEVEEEEEEEEEDSLSKQRKRGRPKGHTFVGWASKKLVAFLNSIKEDSKKPLTLLSLNKLLLRYVDVKKLSSGRRGQIRCDTKLQRLLGKKSVGKFQMMKLLTKHIASSNWTTKIKGGDSLPDCQNNLGVGKGEDKGQNQRKFKKKVDDAKQVKPDPSSYASVDVKNISLIYLKRSLLEEMRGDPNFESKVTGAFVRIRVPTSKVNKNDTCYRLVQIVGIKQAANPRINGRTTDVILEILNLRKREEITVDLISSQDFTEEECQRLRQSVKCGLLKALTVGELEEKARILQEAKVKDWFETELLRLSHLRDRASEKGRKRELRECVERLQLLSSPSERERQLRAPIEATSDPHMDPDYMSDNDGKLMKETQGTESQYGGRQWERNSFSVKYPDNGGWAKAAPYSGPRVQGDQKNSEKGQGWGYACNDKTAELKVGMADDAGGKPTSNSKGNGWRKESQNDEKDVGWTESVGGVKEFDGWADGGSKPDDGWEANVRGQMKDEKCPGINTGDDGWGKQGCVPRKDPWKALARDSQKQEYYDMKDCGWGGNVEKDKSNDGWGSNGVDNNKNDRRGSSAGVNSKDDGKDHCWGGTAGGDVKDHGWGGSAGGKSKDDGWGGSAGGKSKSDDWGGSASGKREDDSWGGNAGGNSEDNGWGDVAGPHCKDGGGWAGKILSKDGGWGGDAHAPKKDDGWEGNTRAHSKDGGWGGNAGAESKDDGWGGNARARCTDDGWGDDGGAHSKDGGWGNHAGSNDMNVGWNEKGGWGKAGGCSRERADVESSSRKSRSGGFDRIEGFPGADTRPPYRDRSASLDEREGFSGADTRPPYRNTEGFGSVSGQSRGAVPDASTRPGVEAIGKTPNKEKEKIWYYQDPSKTIQGPFSMEQLRKWERTKLFPLDLKVWRATEGQDASILLTDALLGRYANDLPPGFGHCVKNPQSSSREGWGRPEEMKRTPGARWQEGGTRPKWDQDNTGNERVPEKCQHSHGDSLGARSWRSLQGPNKPSPPDSGRDGSKGHWDREANYREYSEHHHSHRPGFSPRKKDFPCRYFARGMCKKGEECDFRH